VDRLFVPGCGRPSLTQRKVDSDKDEKLTPEQQKAKEEQDKAKEAQGEEAMTKLAERSAGPGCRRRRLLKLQKEAFEAAGMKMNRRRSTCPRHGAPGLPPAHAAVFDLKPGRCRR